MIISEAEQNRRESRADYRDGNPPAHRVRVEDIERQLEPITKRHTPPAPVYARAEPSAPPAALLASMGMMALSQPTAALYPPTATASGQDAPPSYEDAVGASAPAPKADWV